MAKEIGSWQLYLRILGFHGWSSLLTYLSSYHGSDAGSWYRCGHLFLHFRDGGRDTCCQILTSFAQLRWARHFLSRMFVGSLVSRLSWRSMMKFLNNSIMMDIMLPLTLRLLFQKWEELSEGINAPSIQNGWMFLLRVTRITPPRS